MFLLEDFQFLYYLERGQLFFGIGNLKTTIPEQQFLPEK